MSGTLGVKLIRAKKDYRYMLRNRLRWGFWKGWISVQAARIANRIFGVAVMHGKLTAKIRHNGEWSDLGVLGYQKVTTAFCTFMCAQLGTETSEWGDFKYHDSGVGVTGEANGDTAIETTDGESRATGTQVPSGVTYASVGTITYTTTKAITEHGLFSSASSTTLMDRTVFSALNVVASDSIAFTYTFTATAGG